MPFGVFPYADFRVDHSQLTMPVLMVYGTADISMPVDQGAQQVRAEAPGPVTVLYYGGANHGLRTGEDSHLVPEFLRDLADWVLAPDVPPRVAGEAPRQPFLAGPVPKTPRVSVQAAIVLAGLAGVAAAGLPWRPRRPGRASVPYAIGLTGTVVTAAVHTAYVAKVAALATSYRKNRRLVRGGHRALQGLSLLTGMALGVAAARTRQPTWQGAVGGVSAAALFGLAGYWGAFGREDRLS
jgi:pimeloyl-ACP methyl ester carboxylesterase